MAKTRSTPELDRDLAGLPPDQRWREWMRRIEAVLFASATPVAREDLARVRAAGLNTIQLWVTWAWVEAEPGATARKRWLSRVISWLPVESQL